MAAIARKKRRRTRNTRQLCRSRSARTHESQGNARGGENSDPAFAGTTHRKTLDRRETPILEHRRRLARLFEGDELVRIRLCEQRARQRIVERVSRLERGVL